MAARTNRIVPQARKSLRSIRRSELARMSGDLNPDSNIYSDEDEHPLWWKEIENNTVNLRSSHQTVYDSPVLDPNSDVEGTPLQKSWYKHLDQTTYSNRRSSVPKRQSSNVAGDKSSRLTETSLTDDVIHKKRSRFHVKKRTTHQPEFEKILDTMNESAPLSTRGDTSKHAVNKTDDGTDSSMDKHRIQKTRRLPFKKRLKHIASVGSLGAQNSVTVFEDALDGTIEEETGTKSKEVSNTTSAKSSDIPIQPDVSALVRRRSNLPTADRSTDTSAETAKLNLSKRRRMFTKKRKRISVNYENLWTSNEDNTDLIASQKSGHASTFQPQVEKVMPENASKTVDTRELPNSSPIGRRSNKRQKLSTPHMVESAPVEESLNTHIMDASDIDSITPSPPSPTINEANIELAARSRSQTNKPRIRSIKTVQNELVKLKQRYDDEDSNESDDPISLVWKSSEKSNETTTSKNTKTLQTVDHREAQSPSPTLPRTKRDKKLSTSRMMKSANSEKQLHTQSIEESDIEAITSATPSLTIHEEHITTPATNMSKSNNLKVQFVESRRNKTPISPDESEHDDSTNRSKTNELKVRSVESLRKKTPISADESEDDDFSNRSKTNNLKVRSVETWAKKTPISPDESEDDDFSNRSKTNKLKVRSVESMRKKTPISPYKSKNNSSNRSKTNKSKDQSVESRRNETPISPDESEDDDFSNRSKTNKSKDQSVESRRNKTPISPDESEDDDSTNRSKTNNLKVQSVETWAKKTPIFPDESEHDDSTNRSKTNNLKVQSVENWAKKTPISPYKSKNNSSNRSKTNKSKDQSVESRRNKTPISPDESEDDDFSNRSKTNNLKVQSVESRRKKTPIFPDESEHDDSTNRSKTNKSKDQSVESRRNKTPISPDESEDDDSIEDNDHAVTPSQTTNTPRSVHNRSEEGRQLSALHSRNLLNFEEPVSAANMEESDIDPLTSSASSSIPNERNSQITTKSKSESSKLRIRSIEYLQGKMPKDLRRDTDVIAKLDDDSKNTSIHASPVARESIQETDVSFPASKSKKTLRSGSSRSYTHDDKAPDPQNNSDVRDLRSRSKLSEKPDDEGELDPVNLSSSRSPVTSRQLRSHSRRSNISETANNSIREKDIDQRSRSVGDILKIDTIYEQTASIDQPSTSNSTKSKKSMESKKPAKIVESAKKPTANQISEIIESGKEIENTEPIEMDRPSRAAGAKKAVEFQESVEPDGVTGTAKTAKPTANNTSTGISKPMGKGKSIAKPNPSKEDNLLSQLQSLSEHENDDKWEKAKRALEDVKKKQMALMKMTPIDTYFKVISSNKSVLAGNSQKSGNKPLQKAQSVAKGNKNIPPNVNKAYIVNGQVYKRPRLPRPKEWVTDRMYKFFFKHLEPNFRLNTRVRAEKFVKKLSEVVTIIKRRKKYANYKDELKSLMEEMALLNLIKTPHDFHVFCQDFMPYDFRIKVVPMLLPGNVRNIPFHPEKLHVPILHEE